MFLSMSARFSVSFLSSGVTTDPMFQSISHIYNTDFWTESVIMTSLHHSIKTQSLCLLLVAGDLKTRSCWIKDISQRSCGSIHWDSDIVSAFFVFIDFHLSLHPRALACVENHLYSQQECGSAALLFMDQTDFTDAQNSPEVCVHV